MFTAGFTFMLVLGGGCILDGGSGEGSVYYMRGVRGRGDLPASFCRNPASIISSTTLASSSDIKVSLLDKGTRVGEGRKEGCFRVEEERVCE